MKIFKYPIPITDTQLVAMPSGARILSAQMQRDILTLWALVNPDAPVSPREIRIIGTGHPIPDADKLTFIGTAQQFDGQLIWHVFERAR